MHVYSFADGFLGDFKLIYFPYIKQDFFLMSCVSCSQERQRVIYDEQKKLAQQQAQTKAQMARYEDELARKRMQVIFSSNILFIVVLFIRFNNLYHFSHTS
jgi:hypothetical protein